MLAWAGAARSQAAAAPGTGPADAARSAHEGPPVRPVAVAPGVYLAQGVPAMGSAANRNFISNAAFVVTPDGVVVIDALGAPVLAEELLAAIARVTPLPVRAVIVTHYHADHIYGLQVFKERGAQIVAHAAGRAYLRSETATLRLAASRQELAPWVDEKTRVVAADRWIEGAETLRFGGIEFELRPMGPAHTPEDLAVFLPASGVLFSGDVVFRNRVPWVGQADSAGWIAALQELIALKPRLIVPGHGPVSQAPADDLALTHDYLVHLRRAMGEAARNLEPFEEAYARADWSRFEHLPLFRAANRINAYNTYLLMEQAGTR
ncbi:MAG: MBL fold metallo-hydrolase [Rubrivivax sp.]|nr:MBL fold metallo-hydrolase [Rubrivivax sp.]